MAPLEISDSGPATDMLLLPSVNYSSRLSPPPFPSAISTQSCTADHWRVLILKFTQTPNTFGTIVLVFMQQQNHFMQKSHKTSHCAQYTHKKYETYTIIVRCCFFLNKTTYIHHNINISATGSTHLKSGPTLKEKLKGCKQYTILARRTFMQTMKMCTVHT